MVMPFPPLCAQRSVFSFLLLVSFPDESITQAREFSPMQNSLPKHLGAWPCSHTREQQDPRVSGMPMGMLQPWCAAQALNPGDRETRKPASHATVLFGHQALHGFTMAFLLVNSAPCERPQHCHTPICHTPLPEQVTGQEPRALDSLEGRCLVIRNKAGSQKLDVLFPGHPLQTVST